MSGRIRSAEAEHGRDILIRCGAHHLKRFGPWAITDLSEPESPASPEP